jgi:hypothetical protein
VHRLELEAHPPKSFLCLRCIGLAVIQCIRNEHHAPDAAQQLANISLHMVEYAQPKKSELLISSKFLRGSSVSNVTELLISHYMLYM